MRAAANEPGEVRGDVRGEPPADPPADPTAVERYLVEASALPAEATRSRGTIKRGVVCWGTRNGEASGSGTGITRFGDGRELGCGVTDVVGLGRSLRREGENAVLGLVSGGPLTPESLRFEPFASEPFAPASFASELFASELFASAPFGEEEPVLGAGGGGT